MAKSVTNIVKFYMTKQEDMIKGKYLGHYDITCHAMSHYDPNYNHRHPYNHGQYLDYKTKKCGACHWCADYRNLCYDNERSKNPKHIDEPDRCVHFMYINCPKCNKRSSYGYILSCECDCYMFDCDCGTMITCGKCINDKNNTVQLLEYDDLRYQSTSCFEEATEDYPGITMKVTKYGAIYKFPPNTIFYIDSFDNGFWGPDGGITPSVYPCGRCGAELCTSDK